MKIGFIQYQGHMYSGGQGVYLYYLTRELARMGHEVHVIAGVPYPDVDPSVHIHKLKTFSFWSYLDNFAEYAYRTHPIQFFHPVNLFEFATTRYTLASLLNVFSLRAYHKLNELEQDRPFDLIHDNQTLGYGIWLMKQRGRPVVANIHHPLQVDRLNALREAGSIGAKVSRILWYPWVMQRWVARRLDKIITGSDASAASVAEAFSLPREHVRTILDGVETDVFRPLGLQRETNRVLFVGNSEDRNKGIRYLLEALRLIRDDVPFRLTVVHRPGSKGAPRLVQQLGLHGRVTFLENLSTEELLHEYNRAQVLVSPSLYEGFGLPAAEAQACGTPVVATTAGALPEIVDDGVTGLLVPPGDTGALAEAIRTLLTDPERCRRMGEAGAKRVQEHFSWQRTAEETLALYHEVLGRAPSAGSPRTAAEAADAQVAP